jgi:hypothetical protein
VALADLGRAGYTTYYPRLAERRIVRGRKVVTTPPMFINYCFVLIELGWHAARWWSRPANPSKMVLRRSSPAPNAAPVASSPTRPRSCESRWSDEL